ncbi:MAG: nitroreductase family protein [Desulfobulbaceae bacterium]|nr:nitroreductase family protein [Desulfobulbaceae bacterium]
MEFFEVVRKRRSIRQFTNQPVEKEKIEQILDAALRAPSAMAKRSVDVIAVTDRATLQKLAKAKPVGADFIAGAALAMVVISDPEKSGPAIEDATIAAFSMQLAAQALGLSSCWAHIRGAEYDAEHSSCNYICRELGIPYRLAVECVIAIGYAAEERRAYKPNELASNQLHYERF